MKPYTNTYPNPLEAMMKGYLERAIQKKCRIYQKRNDGIGTDQRTDNQPMNQL
jgi:hypothetical protein